MTAQARLLGGRYQVGELLGYGGMAEVHRGRDLRLGRDVAIKMLRSDLARDATFQERFRREAQNSAALNHPAIVAVYDTGEETSATGDRQPFIVMEFVPGHTLKEELAAQQRIPTRRALEIIADISAALEFSHRHGIIHRDIKPGNVMITGNGQVKVMDFGIARALASGATTMTQTSAVIGTAQYLSPEQARGESVDARSDVYAAGCVLFELLVGHPPFVGDSPVSVAYQHVREAPRAPSDINPDVPPEVDSIVLKALAKNPLNRYQSAQEMRADALRAVAGRPVLAPAVMNEAETMAMAGPAYNQAPTAMTRAIPNGGGMGLPPEAPKKKSSWVMAAVAGLGVLAVIALGIGLAMSQNGGDESEDPKTVTVPAVTGESEADARKALEALNLQVTVGTPVEKQDCDNTVQSQAPVANTANVTEGTQVEIILCKSPDQIEVPTGLVGSKESVAVEAIEGKGLKTNVERVDSLKPEDEVLKVESEGESVDPDETITITVSKGNLIEVPDTTGKSEDTARALLEQAGFTNIVTVPTDQAGEPGTVVEQSPKDGNRGKSTKITLTVIQEQAPDPEPSEGASSSTPPDGGDGGGEGDDGTIFN